MSKNKKPYVANVSTEVSEPAEEAVFEEASTVEEDTTTEVVSTEENASIPSIEEVPPHVDDPIVENPVVEAPVIGEVKVPEIKVVPGMMVTINPDAKFTVTGQVIPEFAHRNVYKVAKVLDDRVIIKAGFYQTVVKVTDLVFQH